MTPVAQGGSPFPEGDLLYLQKCSILIKKVAVPSYKHTACTIIFLST